MGTGQQLTCLIRFQSPKDFMCGTLSWTLAVVNGGNVGENRAPWKRNHIHRHQKTQRLLGSYIDKLMV